MEKKFKFRASSKTKVRVPKKLPKSLQTMMRRWVRDEVRRQTGEFLQDLIGQYMQDRFGDPPDELESWPLPPVRRVARRRDRSNKPPMSQASFRAEETPKAQPAGGPKLHVVTIASNRETETSS